MKRFVILAGLVGLLVGCGGVADPASPARSELGENAAEGVHLIRLAPLYLHGDTAEARLVNGSGRSVGYNLCTSSRERRSESGWVRFEPLRVCTAALYGLAPGAEVLLREPVDPDWQLGEYRLVTRVYDSAANESFEVITDPFEVRAAN